jgi:hypothetical protein
MLKILPHQAVPKWLEEYSPGDSIPFKELLADSVYYPACGFDGDIPNLCMGYSHNFVYVDNLCLWTHTTKETIYAALNHEENFKGFRKIHQQEFSYEELLGPHRIQHEPLRRNDGNPEYGLEPQPFFAILTIFGPNAGLNRKYVMSETSTIHHVYERLAFLYICDDGCRTYEKLYQSHLTKPKAIAIIQPGDAFGGNWTSYYDEKQIFSRIVHKNPGGSPDIMIFGGRDSRGGWYRKKFWSNYSENIYYSRLHSKGISFWKNRYSLNTPSN